MNPRRRRALRLLGLTTVAAVGISYASNASYFDAESLNGSTFTAGTLDLTADPGDKAWTVGNMAPGDIEYRTVTVGNAGTLPLSYSAAVSMTEQSDGQATTNAPTGPNAGLGEVLTFQNYRVLTSGQTCQAGLAAPGEDVGAVGADPTALNASDPYRTLAAGTSEELCYSFTLPLGSDNVYQGDSATYALAFNAAQTGSAPGSTAGDGDVGGTEVPVPAVTSLTGSYADGAATLTWGAVAGAQGYSISRAGASVASTTTMAPTLVVPMDPGTTATYTVRARIGARFSAPVSTTVNAPARAVDNLSALAGQNSVALSWSAGAGAVEYAITRDGAALGTTSETSFLDATAVAGASYLYSVVSTSPGGSSAAVSVRAGASATAPTNISATATSPTTARVDFAPAPGASGYRVQISGAATLSVDVAGSPATLTNLAPGSAYQVAVTALYPGGPGATSAPAPLSTPAAAAGVPALSATTTAITATWAATAGASSYVLRRDGVVVYSGSARIFTDGPLLAGPSYSYTLEAVAGATGSGQSAPASSATVPVAPVPALAATTPSSLRWDWPAIAGATYTVSLDGGAPTSTNQPTFTASGLAPASAHTITVRAVRAGLTGAPGTSSATTAPAALSAPSAPTVSPSFASAALTWTHNGAGSPSGFRLEARTPAGVLVSSAAAPGSARTGTLTGLTENTTYRFTVTAIATGTPEVTSAATTTATTAPAWNAVASMKTARTNLGSTTDSAGRIYAIGGATTGNTSLSSVERFDPTTGAWTDLSSLKTARNYPATTTDSAGRIYAIGGSAAGNTSLSSVERFDPTTGVWTDLSSLKTARYAAAAATDSAGRIYVIGGVTAQGGYLSSVERFDPATGVWTTLNPMGTARGYVAATTDSAGRIYAIGGSTTGTNFLTTVERFDPATGAWTTVDSLNAARNHTGTATDAAGRIYAIGGFAGGTNVLSSVERFDPATESWTTMAAALKTPRSGHGSAVDSMGRIYAIGGFNTGYLSLSSVERLG